MRKKRALRNKVNEKMARRRFPLTMVEIDDNTDRLKLLLENPVRDYCCGELRAQKVNALTRYNGRLGIIVLDGISQG